MEALLGRRDCGRFSPQEQQLSLRAEQLCEAPACFRLLRSRQRLLDHDQPLGNLPGAGETRGQLSEK